MVPKVSVVIPTYNRASLVRRAVESVRNQTYAQLEIIVVDDASQDNTREVVESFRDPRIRYIRHDRNRGGSAARNTGIGAARGEFIAFLDDDDEWEWKKTEEQLKVLRDYDAVLCTSSEEYGILSECGLKKTVELDDLRRGKHTAGGTGVLMAKASILKETLFDESLPRYQDWDLFIRIALKHKIAYLNMPLVRYNEGAHGRITNSILGVPAREMERQYRMLAKHKTFFGNRWFKRHMCKSLLYGIKHRPDKIAHLTYTARRYGIVNVARALLVRVAATVRTSARDSGSMDRQDTKRHTP